MEGEWGDPSECKRVCVVPSPKCSKSGLGMHGCSGPRSIQPGQVTGSRPAPRRSPRAEVRGRGPGSSKGPREPRRRRGSIKRRRRQRRRHPRATGRQLRRRRRQTDRQRDGLGARLGGFRGAPEVGAGRRCNTRRTRRPLTSVCIIPPRGNELRSSLAAWQQQQQQRKKPEPPLWAATTAPRTPARAAASPGCAGFPSARLLATAAPPSWKSDACVTARRASRLAGAAHVTVAIAPARTAAPPSWKSSACVTARRAF